MTELTALIELTAQILAFLTASAGVVLWVRSRRRQHASTTPPVPAATDSELAAVYNARVQDDLYRRIREAARCSGESKRAIAQRFGVSVETVRNILHARSVR